MQKLLEFGQQAAAGAGQQALGRLLQQRTLDRNQVTVIAIGTRQAGQRCQFRFVQQTQFHQLVQADQVGVTGEGRERLVR